MADKKPQRGRVDQAPHVKQLTHYAEGKGDGGSTPPDMTGYQPLTPKMKMACYLYLEYGEKLRAYKEAYPDTNPEAKNTKLRANELFKKPQVVEFLDLLHARARERHDINIDVITKNLIEDRQLAFSVEDAKAAVAADLALAKLHGLLVDRKKMEIHGSLEHHIRQARQRIASGNSTRPLTPLASPDTSEGDIEDAEFQEV